MSQPTFTVADIRKTFLEFFASKGHTVVPSSPLVPGNDPTLLFTNAGHGPVQGRVPRHRQAPLRARGHVAECMRAGGKHNDLENVGYTARHHTFFEMLGNFSFGDYFKRDALQCAWELLTAGLQAAGRQALGHRLHRGRRGLRHLDQGDRPAGRARRAHRRQQGRALRVRQLLDDGRHRPLRPVHARSSTTTAPTIAGGPPGSPDEDGDRYIEIWNNVFMQFNRDRRRRDAAAAQAVRRHRHGPGAPGRGAAARAHRTTRSTSSTR